MDDLENAIETARPYVYPARTALTEALGHACASAKRAPAVLGTAAYPSKWDKAHKYIDELLDLIVGL